MIAFHLNPNTLIGEFNSIAAEAQAKAFFTVGIEIQKEEIERLKGFREKLTELKRKVVEKNHEHDANLIFCIDNSLLAVQSELQMLVNLKEDRMDEAWANLVFAQVTYSTVMGNSSLLNDDGKSYFERLETYEKLLFPQMIFSSLGGIVKKSYCSICNEPYSKCNHIRGRLYNGEICTRVITEMEIEEFSLVDVPANKLCRLLTTSFKGKEVDYLTLREVASRMENDSDKD